MVGNPINVEIISPIRGPCLPTGIDHAYESHVNNAAVALRINPKLPTAYYNRGLLESLQGDLDAALNDFNRAIELAPALSLAYANRGSVRVVLGQLEAAIKDYDRAISLNPRIADLYQNRGVAYLLLHRETEAERDFARCLELDSSLKASLEQLVAAAKKKMISRSR